MYFMNLFLKINKLELHNNYLVSIVIFTFETELESIFILYPRPGRPQCLCQEAGPGHNVSHEQLVPDVSVHGQQHGQQGEAHRI